MKAEIYIADAQTDEVDKLVESIENGSQLKLTAYDGDGEYVGIFLDAKNGARGTLMFTLNKERALFIGRALIAIGESLTHPHEH